MGYNNIDEDSAQSAADRESEAIRILNRIGDTMVHLMHSGEYVPGVSMNARIFVSELVDTLELTGRLTISVKQLWWLRDLNEKVD